MCSSNFPVHHANSFIFADDEKDVIHTGVAMWHNNTCLNFTYVDYATSVAVTHMVFVVPASGG